jgi:hypothetical protein
VTTSERAALEKVQAIERLADEPTVDFSRYRLAERLEAIYTLAREAAALLAPVEPQPCALCVVCGKPIAGWAVGTVSAHNHCGDGPRE